MYWAYRCGGDLDGADAQRWLLETPRPGAVAIPAAAESVVGTGTVLGVAPAAAAEKQVSAKVGPPLKEAIPRGEARRRRDVRSNASQ